MASQNEPPETVVRLNPRRPGAVDGTPDPEITGALHVERVDEEALREGRIWPQSRGSQLAGLCVGSQEGERVLDLCAAPGGKATQLAGEVTAVEKHPGRARELAENCARLGASNVRVINGDALELPAELRDFDHVLVDAPCSGLGVLASRPDLRWRARPLPDLQRTLLRVAAERVRPGGSILYSVCTIAAEENEVVVDACGLEVEPLGGEWPQFAHPRRPEFLLTLPQRDRTSGFFIARLRSPT
jgi:16S rRNA (cytosine967-C5)-methyltransferase